MNVSKNLCIAIFASLAFSCQYNKKPKPMESLAGVLNGDTLFISALDSLLQRELFQLRSQILENWFAKTSLLNEAEKRNIVYDDLIEIEIKGKVGKPSLEEIAEFIRANPAYEGRETQVATIVESINHQKRLKFFVDSLSEYYQKEIFLLPPHDFVLDPTQLFGFELEQRDTQGISVNLIVNFDCHTCIVKLNGIKGLAHKYEDEVNFKITYLNHNYGVEGLGLIAANRQGKAWQMIELMMKRPDEIYNEGFYLEAAEKIGLDLKRFEKDFNNKILMKDLLLTRDYLFSHQVYSTPYFIINGKGYDGQTTMGQLERLIEKTY